MVFFPHAHRVLVVGLLLWAMSGISLAQAGALTVNTLLDITDHSDTLCSLREAYTAANRTIDTTYETDCGTASLTMPNSIYLDVSGTLTLSEPFVSLQRSMSIAGAGRDQITIAYRPVSFWVDDSLFGNFFATQSFALADMTIDARLTLDQLSRGGVVRHEGELTLERMRFVNNQAQIGAVVWAARNTATTTIRDSEFLSNTATINGAALAGSGTLVIENTTFTDQRGAYAVQGFGDVAISDSGFYDNDGGFAGGTQVAMTNVIFDNNGDPTIATRGGAVYIANGATTTDITDSTFSDNQARAGGGLYAEDGALSITRATFDANAATNGNGGAIYTEAPTTISATTLSNNDASADGGAVYALADLTLTAADLTGNSANGDGGAIFVTPAQSLTLDMTTIASNQAGNHGGAIYSAFEAQMTARASVLHDNQALACGAICIGGEASIVNSSLYRNIASAGKGGAIANYGLLTLVNVTLSQNSASDTGGAMHNHLQDMNPNVNRYTPTITGRQVTIAYNQAMAGDSISTESFVYLYNSVLVQSGNGNCSGPDLRGRRNVQDGSSACGRNYTLLSTVDLLPTLSNTSIPYHGLPLGSPLENLGDNSLLPDETTLAIDVDADGTTDDPIDVDQRGMARVVGGTVDIGAVEGTQAVLDVNRDGRVSAVDVIFVINRLDANPQLDANRPADVNGDGHITTTDVDLVRQGLAP